MKRFELNQKVQCNGYSGTVVELCTGKLTGMVVVRLERGDVCLSISDAGLIANPFKCLFCGETYEYGDPNHTHN